MTPHSHKDTRGGGTDAEGGTEGGQWLEREGGVKGTLADLRTPEPGAVEYSGKTGGGQVTGPSTQTSGTGYTRHSWSNVTTSVSFSLATTCSTETTIGSALAACPPVWMLVLWQP